MFTDEDKGREVKIRLINAELVRGEVVAVFNDYAMIKTELADFRVDYKNISTVTRVGDFS